ncbi:hypothetical protein [Staphylococcus saprophyticus]|uniref:hypothetical protein n=1 Tax=Staphylococcus saprophyticus TaxID=29385 RepID=UPI00115AAD92|nr:hypothetical protein [Staphylococcus saprophyticus]TQR88740.1 hypothetical protein FMN82_12280 [Staphylococcus saprophyticus]
MVKVKNSKKNFLPIFFIFFPFVAGGIISYYFEYFSDLKKVMTFITFSSWFFSFFSILLIFVVWEKYRESVVRKDMRDKKYLDREGIEELNSAVLIVRLFVDDQKNMEQLSEKCRAIKYTYEKLKKQKQDTELYSLEYEIRNVFNVINKFKLESIGRNMDEEKWEQIKDKDKKVIGEKLYTLEKELGILLEDVR